MGSIQRTLIEDIGATAGAGVTFNCDTTPNLVNHECIIQLNPSGMTGGNLYLEASDDGTSWAQAVDDDGNNITLAAAAEPRDFAYTLPNYIRMNNTGRTAGSGQGYIKAA